MDYEQRLTQEILHNHITIPTACQTIQRELGQYGPRSSGADNNDIYYTSPLRSWGVNVILRWLDSPNTIYIIYDDVYDNHYSGIITTHQELWVTLNAIVEYIVKSK